jgi:hypothetical protein
VGGLGPQTSCRGYRASTCPLGTAPAVGIHCLQEGWAHALAGVTIWGVAVVAGVAIVAASRSVRGSLARPLPAVILLDPLAAVPAARLLLEEELEPG